MPAFARIIVAFHLCWSAATMLWTLSTPLDETRAASATTRVTWQDVAPLQARLEAGGVTAAGFAAYVERTHRSNLHRVRDGDLDHLIFYALQSRRFTSDPPIEPALSAKAFVEGLGGERDAFLRTHRAPLTAVPVAVRGRIAALLTSLDRPSDDTRLHYFRELVQSAFPDRGTRLDELLGEYQRVMQFVYDKEFVAQRSAQADQAVADLYRTRGLSTDTAVEAGYVVYLGLGVMKSLSPDRPVRRVLIVGPGLDLAPRTGLLEEGPPESYQPWAVIDALLALGLSRADDLEVIGADINPRVVAHLDRSRTAPPALTLTTGIGEDEGVRFSPDYRDYFTALGRAIATAPAVAAADTSAGRLRKAVRVRPDVARTLSAIELDIVTEHLDDRPFDLVVATNILPYFDDRQLMLAMSNIAAMLAPNGVFLHNESRPLLREIAAALGFPLEQSRHATIATVRGAAAPLGDSVYLHRRNAARR